jgi:phosphotriesterase-related protein
MEIAKLLGKAQTVLGPIDPKELGFVLPHEHIFLDISVRFVPPEEDAVARAKALEPVSIRNHAWLRYHYSENKDNLILDNEEVMIQEALLYKGAGGRTIVDRSNWGLSRAPASLARVARATGLNIIMGTGYYTLLSQGNSNLVNESEEQIAEKIVQDITFGVNGICAGMIGEIGTEWPIAEEERKSLRAACLAQRRTGAALDIHPGRYETSPIVLLKIAEDAGADLSRVIMLHMSRTPFKLSTRLEMLATGCSISYDMFGFETYYTRKYGVFDLLNDNQCINEIIELIREGYLGQILVSQDTAFKHCLACNGGRGYAHLLENVIPLMQVKGMTDEQIHTITMENPKRLLTFVAPG